MKTNPNPVRNTECGRRIQSAAPSRRPPPAFTLIELLVVITIIGLLAALTLPAISAMKKQQYIKTVQAEMARLDIALENYKTKYGVYPPGNQNNNSIYAPLDRSQLSQLYYELSGTTNDGTYYRSPDGNQILIGAVTTAYGAGGFINSCRGSGEDASLARNFLPGLSSKQINDQVTNNNIRTTMIVTSVGGPDPNYRPLRASDLNPFRYVYPGTNNPNSYDLWVQLVIGGKTNLVCNWNKKVQLNSPLP